MNFSPVAHCSVQHKFVGATSTKPNTTLQHASTMRVLFAYPTWWWNEEVAEAVREKKKKYRNWRKERSTEVREEYKKSKQNTKKGYFVSNGNETEGTCKRSK